MRPSRWPCLWLPLLIATSTCFAQEWVVVPSGKYVPFFSKDRKSVSIARFEINRFPVKKDEFEGFLKAHPDWSKKTVKRLFADSHYLENWAKLQPNAPVTDVSWFAARAYCQAQGADLPATDQWEYVAKNHRSKVHGMHGDFREWTLDFNGESTDEATQFCGSASLGALDSTDAEAFQRYAYRSSLKADFAVWNLGFRCARSSEGEKP